MADSFLTSTEISTLTGEFSRSFETFTNSRQKTITIFKEPKQVISSRNATNYPGYSSTSNNNNIVSYVPVSGVYPAMILKIGEQKSEELHDPKVNIPKDAKIRIKIEEDCMNFIENGKTEKIIVNGDSYNVASERQVNNFLTLNYYIYYLAKTT